MKKNLLLKLGTTIVLTFPVIAFASCSDSNNNQSTGIKYGTFKADGVSHIDVNNYTNEMIQEYIFTNLITGDKPKGFTKENIILSKVARGNGTITFEATLNKFINTEGKEATEGFAAVEITLIDFKKSQSTNIMKGSFNVKNEKTNTTNNYTDEMIQQYVFDNLITGDKPEIFAKENIILSNVVRGNGKITFSASLNKYINDEGKEETTNFKAVKITFNGFKVLIKTNITSGEITPNGVGIFFTKDYTDEMIQQYVFNNSITGDRPKGFTKENIVLTNVVNGDGTITFNATLNKFIDAEGKEATEGFTSVEMTFNGFKGRTFIKTGPFSLNDVSNTASSGWKVRNILDYILSNEVIMNKPKEFVKENIEINKIEYWNGKLKCKISLTSFIDENGILQTEGFVPVDIVFLGFKESLSTDVFNNEGKEIEIDQTIIKDMFSFNYTDEMILQYVFDNLIDGPKPEGFTIENIVLSNVVRENGWIDFEVSLNKYFDDKGSIQTTDFKIKKLSFGAFKESTQTTLHVGTHVIPGQEEVLAKDYTDEMIRKYVFDNLITGTKPPVSQEELFTITNIKWENGEITFTIALNVFVNGDGKIENSSIIGNMRFKGFKQSPVKFVNRIDDIQEKVINADNKKSKLSKWTSRIFNFK